VLAGVCVLCVCGGGGSNLGFILVLALQGIITIKSHF
jgi:hypothetical protein